MEELFSKNNFYFFNNNSIIIKSFIFLKSKKPDLVLGFGSYVQVPVILAAKILKINIILHEGNLILGNANKYFWKFAKVRTSAFNIIILLKILRLQVCQ